MSLKFIIVVGRLGMLAGWTNLCVRKIRNPSSPERDYIGGLGANDNYLVLG